MRGVCLPRPMPFVAPSRTASPDRKSTRLNSSHSQISYAVFCLKKKHLVHSAVVELLHGDTDAYYHHNPQTHHLAVESVSSAATRLAVGALRALSALSIQDTDQL